MADRVCVICGKPLSGRRKKYCSDDCARIANNRHQNEYYYRDDRKYYKEYYQKNKEVIAKRRKQKWDNLPPKEKEAICKQRHGNYYARIGKDPNAPAPKPVPNTLAWLRKKAGLTQRDLAKHIGVDHMFICRCETKINYMDEQVIAIFADALGCSKDAIRYAVALNPKPQDQSKLYVARVKAFSNGTSELQINPLMIAAKGAKNLIAQKGITQMELAKRIGVSRLTLGRWVNHKVNPSEDYKALLAEALGCSIEELGFQDPQGEE